MLHHKVDGLRADVGVVHVLPAAQDPGFQPARATTAGKPRQAAWPGPLARACEAPPRQACCAWPPRAGTGRAGRWLGCAPAPRPRPPAQLNLGQPGHAIDVIYCRGLPPPLRRARLAGWRNASCPSCGGSAGCAHPGPRAPRRCRRRPVGAVSPGHTRSPSQAPSASPGLGTSFMSTRCAVKPATDACAAAADVVAGGRSSPT